MGNNARMAPPPLALSNRPGFNAQPAMLRHQQSLVATSDNQALGLAKDGLQLVLEVFILEKLLGNWSMTRKAVVKTGEVANDTANCVASKTYEASKATAGFAKDVV